MASPSHTLKIDKEDLVLPGLAVPDAFRALDSRLESTLQLCSLKDGTVDAPFLGLVTVCQEMQTLLKLAFIENGLLASRLELLSRYQAESVRSTDRKVAQVQLSHKTTKKQVKRLRKKLSVYDTLQRKKSEQWWDVKVHATDYDSFAYLSRGSGSPDLEFMLRINQILVDFVQDADRQELVLPPLGNEERAELSKLASTYKLRCRYGKSTQLATSTLIKARQTTIPNPGEVDTVLNTFARNHKKSESERSEDVTEMQDAKSSPEPIKGKPLSPCNTLPSTILTPLSTLTSPIIDIGLSPPTSQLPTPTAESAPPLPAVKPVTDITKKEISENPFPKKPELVKPVLLRDPRLPSHNLQRLSQQLSSTAQTRPSSPTTSTLGTVKPLLLGDASQTKRSTAVLPPLKQEAVGKKMDEGVSNKREKEMPPSLPKRIRLTRKSAGTNNEQNNN